MVFYTKKKMIELDGLDFLVNSVNHECILYIKNKKTEYENINKS